MKQIEKLLAEYKIRFRDTDRILEKGYPLKPVHLNRGDYSEVINCSCITNINGRVYLDGEWATADIKDAPKKWVIEKDEGNPLWEKFKEWWDNEQLHDFSKEIKEVLFFSHHRYNTDILVFKRYQYLTLEQWYELIYLPEQKKVDLSILNDEDWFYIENMYGYLIRGNISLNGYELSFDNVYCIKTNTLRFNESMISDNITLLRKATPEDLKPLYKNHPELEPPKVGDLCVFFDDKEILNKKLIGISFLNKINENTYSAYSDYHNDFEHAMKILPTWGYDEILSRYETFKKVMLCLHNQQ